MYIHKYFLIQTLTDMGVNNWAAESTVKGAIRICTVIVHIFKQLLQTLIIESYS